MGVTLKIADKRKRIIGKYDFNRARITKYLASETDSMAEHAKHPGMLRIAAAVILGLISGTILFLIAALGIGVVNDRLSTQIPINLLIAENIFSAILLILFILICIAGFIWQVWITPSDMDREDFGPDEDDEKDDEL